MNNTHTSFSKVWQIASYKSIVGDVNVNKLGLSLSPMTNREKFYNICI